MYELYHITVPQKPSVPVAQTTLCPKPRLYIPLIPPEPHCSVAMLPSGKTWKSSLHGPAALQPPQAPRCQRLMTCSRVHMGPPRILRHIKSTLRHVKTVREGFRAISRPETVEFKHLQQRRSFLRCRCS